jgi:excisionase family DNA binding protein
MNTTVTPANEDLWTVKEVAAYLKASTSYVYKAAERGELPCRRLGALLRFLPDQVRAWARGESHSAPVLPLRPPVRLGRP